MRRKSVFSYQIFTLLAILGLAVLGGCPKATDPVSIKPAPDRGDFLTQQQRQYLWDIEHQGFVLEQKVFPEIKRLIRESSIDELQKYFAKDATAETPGQWELVYSDSSVEKQTLTVEDASGAGTPANFLAMLTEMRGSLDADPSACRVGIGILRLSPDGDDGGWDTKWKLRLAGSRSGSPVELNLKLQLRLARINDQLAAEEGWIEQAALVYGNRIESPAALMLEITDKTGIQTETLYDTWRPQPFRSNTGGVYLSDYNGDQIVDVLIDDVEAGVALYRGLGDGRFEDVTTEAGLDDAQRPVWALSCWGDFDGDGDPDLISEDRLYENLGDGTFANITDQSNLLLTPAQGYSVADYDGDGRLDIYVCHSSSYRIGQEKVSNSAWIDGGTGIDNTLWRNKGDWDFEDVTLSSQSGGAGSSCFTGVWLDANADHIPDLLAINEFGKNLLHLFDERGVAKGVPLDPVFGGFSMGAAAGDMDNDGNTDLYVANMYSKAGNRILSNVDDGTYPSELLEKLREGTAGSKLYFSGGDGSFQVADPQKSVSDIGWAYGSSLTDYNGDGFLDIYATAGFKSQERGKPDG